MKKLIKLLLCAFAVVCVFSLCLTACGEDDEESGGGGGNNGGSAVTTTAGATEAYNALSESNDKTTVESNASAYIGVSVALPTASAVSAKKYSFNDVNSYVVELTGASVTAADYYSSLKAELTAKGWTANDEEQVLYKISGDVVYGISVEGDEESANDKDFCVGYTIADKSVMDEDGDGGSDGGSGGDGGNTAVWPTAQITAAIGVNALPVYAGTATNITFVNSAIQNTALITVYGATESDVTAYKALLTSNGFTLKAESGAYVKTSGTTKVAVTATFVDASAISAASSMSVVVEYTPANELLTEWPTATLVAFAGDGVIPAIVGAENYELKAYASNQATLTISGITESEYEAYCTLLLANSFYGEYDYYTYSYANKNSLTASLDYDSTEEQLEVNLEVSAYVAPSYTLPTNVAVSYSINTVSGSSYYKIGENYYKQDSLEKIYLKKDGNVWKKYFSEYEYPGWSAWELSDTTYTAATIDGEVEYVFDVMLGYDDINEQFVKQAETATVAGVTCDVYSYTVFSYTYSYYVNPTNNLIYKYIVMDTVYFEITAFDTSVTGFGAIDLP